MIFIYKRNDVSFKDVYWQGSFIYRNLNKYVKKEHIKKIMILTYIGIGSFLGFIGSLFLMPFLK